MRQDIINVATKEIGVSEYPPGSNSVKYNDWLYGADYAAKLLPSQKEWCCAFYSYVRHEAGASIGKGDFLKGFASVPFFYQHFKANITTNPQPGDAVIYDWEMGKPGHVCTDWTPRHIGMFVEWIDKKAGTFYTIEGNTSTTNQSNGGMVMKRQRNLAFVQAFINPLNL